MSRADGLGISEIKKLAIEQIILSTETNPIVAARAKKLDLFCIQGVDNKAQILTDYCKNHQFELIKSCDDEFKYWLDRYKYFDRYPEKDRRYYRKECESYLSRLNHLLIKNKSKHAGNKIVISGVNKKSSF